MQPLRFPQRSKAKASFHLVAGKLKEGGGSIEKKEISLA